MKPPVRAYASSEATQGWTAGFRAVAKRLDVRGNRAGCTKNQDAITEPLFGLAKEFGGSYDGWGCPVVR
jgi:hypothetical protein